jgi:uncharacterized metal-binding protein YceD (DUF177 family)
MGKFTEFKLPLKTLQPGEHKFSYTLGKQFFVNMESADIRDAQLSVDLTVNYRADIYDLDFAITGEVTLLCDRCLDEMQYPIDATYHVMVKYGDRYRDDSDEVLEIPFSENDLNVAYMIYDTVSLEVPIKHVHPQGKCNRQMSQMLKKHRAHDSNDSDAELEDQLIDEIDTLDVDNNTDGNFDIDPRWNALKGLSIDEDN